MAVNRQYSLTEEEMDDIRSLFGGYDKDGSGKITKSEVAAAMSGRNGNLSYSDVNFMMRTLDIDGSDDVSFDEFLTMAILCQGGEDLSELQIKQLFKAFDTDGDGVLSADELKQLWNIATTSNTKQISDEQMNEMIKAIDTNGDGQIDYEEFVKLMLSQ